MLGWGRKKLYTEGVPAEGLVVHRSDTTSGINYHVTIRVKLADGTATEFKKWLDWHDVGQLHVGSVVPVRYDRSDPSKVALDMPALEERHAQEATAGKSQLDAQFARLGPAGAAGDRATDVQARTDLGDLKAQLLQIASENPGSVVNLSSGPPRQSGSDPVARLAELADLKKQGVLSEEEFAAAKARILSEI
jgi:Short C-terminal domain